MPLSRDIHAPVCIPPSEFGFSPGLLKVIASKLLPPFVSVPKLSSAPFSVASSLAILEAISSNSLVSASICLMISPSVATGSGKQAAMHQSHGESSSMIATLPLSAAMGPVSLWQKWLNCACRGHCCARIFFKRFCVSVRGARFLHSLGRSADLGGGAHPARGSCHGFPAPVITAVPKRGSCMFEGVCPVFLRTVRPTRHTHQKRHFSH